MNIKEIRAQSNEELALQRRNLKEEALNLRIQQESGQLENPARIRNVRREIARIETILSDRRITAQETAAAPAAETTEA